VKRIPYEKARLASTTHGYDYVDSYVKELGAVIDMEVIRSANLAIGVDPLGGAGVNYWEPIAERYGFPINVVIWESAGPPCGGLYLKPPSSGGL